VVVDDAAMKITHVIRGDDHLSNTPKQVALYEALGLAVPEFAHLSTILGPDRERLSKRHGATSVANFREMGILPEALMNYLALLGWAPSGGDREIFPKPELIKEFQLERVTPSPAIFDTEKLYWLNRHYIKQCPAQRIHDLATPFLQRANLLPQEMPAEVKQWSERLIDLMVPYVDRLDQLAERAGIIFRFDGGAAASDPGNTEVLATATTADVLAMFLDRVTAVDYQPTAEHFQAIMNEIKTKTGVKGKELFHPVRVMLIGSHSGPDFNKLIPVIEEGSRLPLPVHVKSVRERAQEFMEAWRRRL
jgi:nondiscriminating glutamyl-tRNA synthetase